MYTLGITGLIASGKSTVCEMLARQGIPVLSADALIHNLQAPDSPQTQAIAQTFGTDILTPEGGIDRHKLTTKLTTPEHWRTLENILHPALKALMAQKKAAFAAAETPPPILILEVPLLYSANFHTLCNGTIVCRCPEETRKARAFARPTMTEEKWQTINERQAANAALFHQATHTLETNTSLEQSKQSVQEILEKIICRP